MSGEIKDEPPAADYESNVFVNCPFDEDYRPLMRPLLFTVICLGYTPRLASERSDSGENRVDKICDLIYESKYSIHDLSRLKSEEAGEFYRLNMPFELGIDYGARRYGSDVMAGKRCMILETAPYDYQVALSDLSGVDIKNHDDKPEEIVRAVRDWFYETVQLTNLHSPTKIWNWFTDFQTYLFESRQENGLSEEDVTKDIERMPVSEYIDSVRHWVDLGKPAL